MWKIRKITSLWRYKWCSSIHALYDHHTLRALHNHVWHQNGAPKRAELRTTRWLSYESHFDSLIFFSAWSLIWLIILERVNTCNITEKISKVICVMTMHTHTQNSDASPCIRAFVPLENVFTFWINIFLSECTQITFDVFSVMLQAFTLSEIISHSHIHCTDYTWLTNDESSPPQVKTIHITYRNCHSHLLRQWSKYHIYHVCTT